MCQRCSTVASFVDRSGAHVVSAFNAACVGTEWSADGRSTGRYRTITIEEMREWFYETLRARYYIFKAMEDPSGAQIIYLITAGSVTISTVMGMFVWHDDDDYKTGVIRSGDTNWWQISDQVDQYSTLVIMSAAFVTQILAIFDISPDINNYVWDYGVGYVLRAFKVIAIFMMYLGYDSASIVI